MTRSPKIVGPRQLAAEALATMNEKKITVLFVVDPAGQNIANPSASFICTIACRQGCNRWPGGEQRAKPWSRNWVRAPVRSRTEWAAQRRASATKCGAIRASSIVMKRILPLAASVLWRPSLPIRCNRGSRTRQNRHSFSRNWEFDKGDLAMVKPNLSGTDSSGDPFVVTAAKATQFAHDPDRALLDNVEADLTLRDGNWLNATSPHGLLDAPHPAQHCTKITCPSKQTLDMLGSIAVFSDNGYEVHTMFAHVDMSAASPRATDM